jgi:hypothetical protein
MTALYAAILLFSASGSASRTAEYEQSIGGIVLQCIAGAISDGMDGRTHGSDWSLARINAAVEAADIRLRIDGQPRTGWRAWAEAVWRVVGYVGDRQHAGSVGYEYRVRLSGFDDVTTSTEIRDGRVVKIVNASWVEVVKIGRLTRRIPIHVSIEIRATESSDGVTRLVGTATGRADMRDFDCGLVRRFADKRASDELREGLDTALSTIQREGVAFYRGADAIAPVVERIRAGFDLGRIVIGGRR